MMILDDVVMKQNSLARHRMSRINSKVFILLTQFLVLSIDYCGSYMITPLTPTSRIAFVSVLQKKVVHQPHSRRYIHSFKRYQPILTASTRFIGRNNNNNRSPPMSASSSSSSSDDALADHTTTVIPVCTLPLLCGGSYIGLSSTFDACQRIGQHIPIDERYIPSSLLEWGYVPTTLETIVFETVNTKGIESQSERILKDTTSTSSSSSIGATIDMKRSIYTILPATGCDNDNLETIASTEQYTNGYTQLTSTAATWYTTLYNKNSNIMGIETCFRWLPNNTHCANSGSSSNTLNDELYRIRVNVELQRVDDESMNVDVSATTESKRIWKIVNPIGVSIEKQLVESSIQINPDSIKSGGLDSRTITQLLGPILHSENMRSFPTQPPIHFNTFDNVIHTTTGETEKEVITIPGNITITASQTNTEDVYQIDIGYISSIQQQQQSPLDPTRTQNDNNIYTVISHQFPAHYKTHDDNDLSHVLVSTRVIDL